MIIEYLFIVFSYIAFNLYCLSSFSCLPSLLLLWAGHFRSASHFLSWVMRFLAIIFVTFIFCSRFNFYVFYWEGECLFWYIRFTSLSSCTNFFAFSIKLHQLHIDLLFKMLKFSSEFHHKFWFLFMRSAVLLSVCWCCCWCLLFANLNNLWGRAGRNRLFFYRFRLA